MQHPASTSEIEILRQHLVFLTSVYEEMITGGQEFESVKPILVQIRQMEQAIRNLSRE